MREAETVTDSGSTACASAGSGDSSVMNTKPERQEKWRKEIPELSRQGTGLAAASLMKW